MNGQENEILNLIREDIKKTQDSIEKTRDEVVDVKTTLAATKASVDNLHDYVDSISARIEVWTHKGCPHGQVNATGIANCKEKLEDLSKDIKEVKKETSDIKERNPELSIKKIVAITGGTAAIITAIAQLLIALV